MDQEAGETTCETSDGPECAIINVMVEFCAVAREVSLHIYMSTLPIQDKILRAIEIDRHLDSWADNLPSGLEFCRTSTVSKSLKSVKDPNYLKLQRLVLTIRIAT